MNMLNTRQKLRIIDDARVSSFHDWGALDNLENEEGAELLLEAATLEDVELAYIGEHLTGYEETAMFEAISTTRTQLARSMRAFSRKLDQSLSSFGINTVSDAPQGDKATVGGVEISKVRKVAGIPILVARVSLSDGQSVSLVFHSPTATSGNISGSDIITVFRFLLNKRDVTHVVAPQNGTDISLSQVSQLLARLIGKNSPKFQRQQNIAQRTREELDAATSDIDNLEAQQTQLTVQAEQAELNATQAEKDLTAQQDRLNNAAVVTARMTKERDDLATQLTALRNKPAVSPFSHAQEAYAAGYNTAAAGGAKTLPDGLTGDLADAWIQGHQAFSTEADLWQNIHGSLVGFLPDPNPVMGKIRKFDDPQNRMEEDDAAKKELANKAQEEHDDHQQNKDNEKGEHEDHTAALFWYGMRTRGASPGAVPKDFAAVLTPEETADLEIVKRKEIPPEWFKYGAVGYPQALSPQKSDHFSLTDFANVVTQKSSLDVVNRLKEYVKQLREANPDAEFDEIFQDYFHPRGRYTDQVPIKNSAGQYDIRLLTTVLRANFKGQSPSAVMEGWWDEFSPQKSAPAELVFDPEKPLDVVRQWMKNVLLANQEYTDGQLWTWYIANSFPNNPPTGYDQEAVWNALDAAFNEQDTQQNFYRLMAQVRANMQFLKEGNAWTIELVESYADDLPTGSRDYASYFNPSEDSATTNTRLKAMLSVYQQVKGSMYYGFPKLAVPKSVVEQVFSSYMDMKSDEARTISNIADTGKLPSGDIVNLPSQKELKFQGTELLKGNYTREQFEHLFASLGGYIAAPLDETAKQIAELMDTLQTIYQFTSTDISEWQEKQDDIAKLAQQLTDISEAAYADHKADLEKAINWVAEKIQSLSTGQRDINTGKKEGQTVQAFTATSLNDWFESVTTMAGGSTRTLTGLGQLEDDARGYDEDDAVLGILNAAVPVGIKNYGFSPDNYDTVAECIIEVAAIKLNNWANSVKLTDVDEKVIPFPFDEATAGLSDYIQYIQKVRTIRDTLNAVLDAWDSGKLTRPKLAARLDGELNDYTTRWEDFNDEERASLATFLSMPDSSRRPEIARILRIRVSQLTANINWAEPERSRLMDLRKKEIKKREEEQQAILDAFNQQMTDQLNEILSSRAQYSNEVEALVNRATDLELQITEKGQLFKFEDLLANVDEHLMNLRAQAATAEPPATPEADPAVATAIQSARDLLNLQSSDMAELRAARQQLRGIYQTLQDAGQLDANNELLDGAARHLADLLIAIQKAGVA
ncbi:hypothetical protein NLN92_14335 [Citrobacter portucalensis]|uniref:defense against restriction DarA-related protein n=1 Tax=Citrobacter portucalensis TaxID=1639133 RepID=UPI00226B2D52|nr:hypothetical protein [Citrobacter portucalensis]MCX8979187.1 hypothetical protein [Citrobacter portucalensis]